MHPLNKNPNFRSYKKAMNMQKLYQFTIVILMCSVNLLCIHPLTKNGGHGDPMEDDARHRLDYEFRRLAGPDGTIPQHMREKELAFAATLPTNNSLQQNNSNSRMQSQASWNARGPWNVGGRTRALGIDVLNDQHYISGTTSGGIWTTNDAGITWSKFTPSLNYHGITSLQQDSRAGHENTWYAGSGEPYGQSASGGSAYFLGNGMLKSTDNGLTWQPLATTVTNTPQSFDSFWDMNWNLALDLHDSINNVLYVANLGGIYKSINGGTSWTTVRGGSTSNYSYFTDVAVTLDSGIVYATLSSDGPHKGIWRSVNQCATWTKISTGPFGDSLCNRVVMGINPSNTNEIYFLGNSEGLGMPDTNFVGDIEYNTLWRYTYLNGNGSGSGGVWEDLSMNLPNSGHYGMFGDFNAQGSYDLVVRVKPDDPTTVFIGGTNIYRSTSRFNDTTNTTYIGGYLPYSALPVIASYPNHHPDQHTMTFLPSNPDVMISTNDGGIFRTSDCSQSTVVWNSLNNGYVTSMFYTVEIDHATIGNDIIVAGAQDNGTWYTNTTSLTTPWVQPNSGDGSYCAIADNQSAYYFSIQKGKMRRCILDGAGNVTSFARIDPIGGTNYEFINPFVLDPNNNNIMYLAGGKYLWRNDDLSTIPMVGNWDSISTNWVQWTDSVPNANQTITALTCCKTPANRVYYGTSQKRIYKVNNANVGTPTPLDISGTTFPTTGYVSCIATDPNNGDHVMVVFSNYNLYSLFYSADAGVSWTKVAGNLEQFPSGTGNGPSLRWASFLPVSDGMIYIISTSVGVFATDTLTGTNTTWVNQAENTIGKSVCDMTTVRIGDGLVAIATHSQGIFSTHLTSVNDIVTVHEYPNSISLGIIIYPNPASDQINISYNIPTDLNTKLYLLDERGRTIRTLSTGRKSKGIYEESINVSDLAIGIYYVSLRAGDLSETKAIVIAK